MLDLLVGDLFVVEDDQLADAAFVGPQLLTHRHDRAGDRRGAGDRLDHRQLAALDALGDLDFAFAGEEGHGAHLAQVHADGIVGLVEGAGREVQFDFFGPFTGSIELLLFPERLLRVDDLDARAAERTEQIIEILRRRDVGGQDFVDLVVQQVSLFLTDRDELFHLVVSFFDRQRHSCFLYSFRGSAPDPGSGALGDSLAPLRFLAGARCAP